MNFKDFLIEAEEEEKNVKSMLKKLPAGHRKMLTGYKFKFTGGNCLDNDDGHIGIIKGDKITVAAPWNYARSLTTLHEIAHLVWQEKMTSELKKEWSHLLKKTHSKQKQYVKSKGESTDALDQSEEEMFCMAYGATYSKHAPLIFHNKEWTKFIKKIA